MQRRALGRGLQALISQSDVEGAADPLTVDIGAVQPNPFQPRRAFDPDKLGELAESIRRHGILQPLLVRRQGEQFQLVAGERRWRAAQLAGLSRVPVIVVDVDDVSMVQMALVENLQREDLGPLEEAEAYYRLQTEFGMTQEEIAAAVGKSRPVVANALRLLKLPPPIRESVSRGTISVGHARALLALEGESQVEAWRRVVEGQLNVRQTEALVELMLHGSQESGEKTPETSEAKEAVEEAKAGKARADLPPEIRDVQERLQRRFGTQVSIVLGRKKGTLAINFYGLDDLQRILELFGFSGEERLGEPQ